MTDHKEAWLQKAKIDYFAPFISMWLACNSWYRAHYSDVVGSDRKFIDKLKTDFSGRNHLYTNFKKTLAGEKSKKDIPFKANLEMLHHSLNRANFQSEKLIKPCSFNSFLPDYNKKDDAAAYVNILANPKINKDGTISSEYEGKVVRLDEVYIISDYEIVFAGLLETIYQIRHMVVHGQVKPEKDEHEVVKYCYLILHDMMDA